MTKQYWLPKLAAFSIALAPSLSAQMQNAPASTEAEPTQLAPYVFTATRTPVEARRLGSVVDVVTPAEAGRRQLTTLGAALAQAAGVPSVSTGAAGAVRSVFLRGMNSNQVLFLVDGIRMNDSNTDYSAFLGGATLGSADTLEVARGPQSTLYGADALGGVVALRAERGEAAAAATRTGFEFGSFETVAGSLSSQGASGGLSYNATLRAATTQNERANNDFESLNGSVRLDTAVASWASVGTTLRFFQGNYEVPGDRFAPTSGVENEEQNFLGTVFAELRNGERLHSRVTLGGQGRRFLARSSGATTDTIKNRRLVIDWQSSLEATARQRFTGGFTGEHAHTKNSGFGKIDKAQDSLAFFLNHEYSPLDTLHLSAGLRHDDFDTFGGKLTGRGSAAWLLAEQRVKLRASYGSGFRAPSFLDLYGVDSGYLGNPNLKPESSRGWDAGLDFYLPNESGVIALTWFENRIADLIVFDFASSPWTTQNVERARTRGLEAKLDIRFASQSRAQLGYNYLEAENRSSGARLLRRPRHSINADLSQDFGPRLSAGIGLRWVADRQDIHAQTFGAIDAEDYTTLRAYLSYLVNANLALKLRVENALDERYEDAHGYPALGAGAYLSVEWRL